MPLPWLPPIRAPGEEKRERKGWWSPAAAFLAPARASGGGDVGSGVGGGAGAGGGGVRAILPSHIF
jgi:hypothetical protein